MAAGRLWDELRQRQLWRKPTIKSEEEESIVGRLVEIDGATSGIMILILPVLREAIDGTDKLTVDRRQLPDE